MKRIANIMLIGVAIIWGSGFIFSQMALDAQISPFIILSIRFTIATLIILIVGWKKLNNFNRFEWISGGITGFLLYAAFAFQTIGLQYTTPSSNAFLTATNVVIVPIIYWGIYKKLPSKSLILGSVLAILGIGLLTIKEDFSIGVGDSLSLVCAILFAMHVICIGHFSKAISIEKLTLLQMLVATVLSIFSMGIFEYEALLVTRFTGEGIIAVIYLGVMSTCVAFFMQTCAQKYTSTIETSIFLSSEALFATVLSVILGYELFNLKLLIGGGCVLSATIVAERGSMIWQKLKDNYAQKLEKEGM